MMCAVLPCLGCRVIAVFKSALEQEPVTVPDVAVLLGKMQQTQMLKQHVTLMLF